MLSQKMMERIRHGIRISLGGNSGAGIFLITVFFAVALLARGLWQIFDYGCPTFALNFVQQISEGIFTPSFPGIPGVAANYHLGTFWIAGALSWAFSLPSGLALLLVVWFAGVGLFFFVMKWAVEKCGFWLGASIVVASFFATSLPNELMVMFPSEFVGWYNYVSLWEYLLSTSWPVSLLILNFAIVNSDKHDDLVKKFLVPVYVLGFFNAYIFSVLQVSLLIFIILRVFDTRAVNLKRDAIYFLLVLLSRIPPMRLPSAMQSGDSYEALIVKLHFFHPDFWGHALQYISLMNPLHFVALGCAGILLLRGNTHARFLAILFGVTFFLPLMILTENVSAWDNRHKAIIFCSYLGIFIFVHLSAVQSEVWPKIFAAGWRVPKQVFLTAVLSLSFLVSIPASYNLLVSRTVLADGFSFQDSFLLPVDGELAAYLNAQKQPVMLWAYPKMGLCGDLAHTVSHTSTSMGGLYGSSFLMAPTLEKLSASEGFWYKSGNTQFLDRYPEKRPLFITNLDASEAFLDAVTVLGIDVEFLLKTKYFVVYAIKET